MFRSLINRFLREETGEHTVEYSIFLAFMGLAAVMALETAKAGFHTIVANLHHSH